MKAGARSLIASHENLTHQIKMARSKVK